MTAEDFVVQSYKTPFIMTYSGKKVNPLDLHPEDISIDDIAHHLATINRWCGALREPISVAQHCVHVSWLCDESGAELEGLLHDASEAYLGDVTKWIKGSDGMRAYREAEKRAMDVISRKFYMANPLPRIVEEADKLMIGVEAFFGIPGWQAMPGYDLPTIEIFEKARFCDAWPWQVAERNFKVRFAAVSR